MTFESAKDQQWTWKTKETKRAQCELIKAGLSELYNGRDFFGPDNIPDDITFSGNGIMGNATKSLMSAHIIEEIHGWGIEERVTHGRRRSLRKSANGRKVQLYALVSLGVAESFLRRNKAAYEEPQMDMFSMRAESDRLARKLTELENRVAKLKGEQ